MKVSSMQLFSKQWKHFRFYYFLLLMLVEINVCLGQDNSIDTLLFQNLNPVTVSTTRISQIDLKSPLSVTSINKTDLQKGQALLTADEGLQFVPGVFILNNTNFAQDLRVSIRGFGARAAFGIRGIKLLVDGLPETTPDGQAQVDNLDLGLMEKLEVIRGPASGLYGNASGGVINYTTESPTEAFTIESNIAFGSFNFQKYQLKIGQDLGRFSYILNGNRTSTDGYRQNSGMESNLINGKLQYDLSTNTDLKLIFNYMDSPKADDPGGINLEQATNNPESARDANLNFNSGEEIQQGKIGLVLNSRLSDNQSIGANAFYIFRNFSNFLPFQGSGSVAFDRSFFGFGAHHNLSKDLGTVKVNFQTGFDFGSQRDDRTRFNNLNGVRGELRLDQEEIFQSFGIFHLQEWIINPSLLITAGLRYDANLLEIEDLFLSDGDDAGDQTLNSLNPSVGVNFKITDSINGFGNVSTSFETPTLAELSNNPDGSGGFNDNLDPQKAINYEIGVKGNVTNKFKYELALFHIDLTNEFIPFELEAFPGRTFYRNAGSSNRNGIELSGQLQVAKGLNAVLNYTYSDFTFDEFNLDGESLDGNQTPGIPEHNGLFGFNYLNSNGLFISSQLRFIGALFADNGNETKVDSYALLNFRASYDFDIPKATISPFFGINNVTDTNYNANIRINAFGRRYYEPAPGVNFYAGLNFKLNP